jgi:hypothetical protein
MAQDNEGLKIEAIEGIQVFEVEGFRFLLDLYPQPVEPQGWEVFALIVPGGNGEVWWGTKEELARTAQESLENPTATEILPVLRPDGSPSRALTEDQMQNLGWQNLVS